MSMITEQVEYLIKLSNKHPFDSNILTLQRACKEAAKTIAQLAAKVRADNMERSTAYYHGGWIPVNERLPKNSGEYLVSVIDDEDEDYKHVGVAYFAHPNDYDIDKGEWRELMIDEKVIAWMPLPEPYREDGETE